MPGAGCTRSLVCSVVSTRVFTTGSARRPGIPYAMVLTAYVVLSPVIGLSCHRRPAEKWFCKTRSGPQHLRKDLTPASRRQDHTIWPYVIASFVRALPIAHG
ncbi:hypothetical protein SAMN05444159_4290 [Bradyrhizobium lablabi]|uniref:Uncharacterized protein n=1 Tax=Bradyrhizobium lablabi TaxID=722472 RepID=A0A1M6VMY5_9BRAD|nr:hypothetical protein SAMN05444159_4290 [Bradyrhizobium lablabi]